MPAPALRGGPNSVSLRVIVEAILYMLLTGRQCQMRLKVPTVRQVECRRRWQIPKDFSTFTAVQLYFYHFSCEGILASINQDRATMVRKQVGRPASSTADVIDSQSLKTTRRVGRAASIR